MIKAALIGCGRIGYSFEKDKISGDSLSHFHELNKNEDIQLEAVVDSEFETIQHISNKYKIRTYRDHQELIKSHNLDLIVIATPDETHFDIAIDVLKNSPKLVFIEKPLAKNTEQVNNIINLYKKNNIKIMVNFSRRFFDPFMTWKEMISNSSLVIKNIILKYTGTLIHNGIHFLDLMIYFFGRPDSTISLSNNKEYPTFELNYSKFSFKVLFIGLGNLSASIEEIDIIHENGRFKVNNTGISSYVISSDPNYKGFKIFGNKKVVVDNSSKAIKNAYNNIVDSIQNGASLISPGSDSNLSMEIVNKIIGGN
tara:strand:- start:181 stop:1113 length:933 start_codon:yes stop_codon:yes gene_type:complete